MVSQLQYDAEEYKQRSRVCDGTTLSNKVQGHVLQCHQQGQTVWKGAKGVYCKRGCHRSVEAAPKEQCEVEVGTGLTD